MLDVGMGVITLQRTALILHEGKQSAQTWQRRERLQKTEQLGTKGAGEVKQANQIRMSRIQI